MTRKLLFLLLFVSTCAFAHIETYTRIPEVWEHAGMPAIKSWHSIGIKNETSSTIYCTVDIRVDVPGGTMAYRRLETLRPYRAYIHQDRPKTVAAAAPGNYPVKALTIVECNNGESHQSSDESVLHTN